MKEVHTHLALEGEDVVVRSYQDIEDIVDRTKMFREQPNRGDFHHKWTLPNNLVVKFYNEYCGDGFAAARPMDQNFWEWVDKKISNDPDYKIFKAHDPQYQHRVGYGS